MNAPNLTDELEFDPELVHGYWVRVPSAFVRSPRFTPTAKALYTLLLTYAGERTVAWPGQGTLCEALAVSENTLRKALRELSDAGLVTIQRRGDGKTARYYVRKWQPETAPIQNLKICGSEMSRTSESAAPSEIETLSRNRDSGGYARERRAEKPPVEKTMAAAAPSASSQSYAPGNTAQPPTDRCSKSLPAKPSAPAVPDGVKLIDAEPAAVEKLSPEALLARFRAEHPDRWGRVAKIAERGDVQKPRIVQRLEVLAILGELRDERQRDAEKKPSGPKAPAPWEVAGPLPSMAARKRQAAASAGGVS